ncbi:MAG TPA: hypothetical protein PLX35_09850 [Cyclobacteriaceae bacterium]|nr:hypothetical protein [Cyclobacteriaceae bacterium]
MDLSRRAYLIILCFVAGLFTAILSTRPYYNWDMFPYIAITLGAGDQHQQTYEEAASHMPVSDFEALAARQPIFYVDARAFQSILPYYQTKPGYTAITRLLYTAGVNATMATYVPSLFSYFVLLLIVGSWLMYLLPTRHALMVTLGIAILPFLSMTARYSSPDMLCAAYSVAGLYFLSVYRSSWGLVFFTLAIATRPDVVMLILPLVYCVQQEGIITKRLSWIFSLAAVTTTVWALGSIELIPEYMFTLKPWSHEFTMQEFITSYFYNVQHGLPSVINSSMPIFVLLLIIAWIYQGRVNPTPFWANCIVAALFSIAMRYILHPIMEDRFAISAYLIILIGALHIFFAKASSGPTENINLSNT